MRISRTWRYLILGALGLATFACFVWIARSTDAFGHCIKERKNYKEYEALHESSLFIIKFLVRLGLNSTCGAHAANVYQGVIAALAGVAVAGFTGTLWWVTVGLWRATRQSIDIANKEFVSAHPPRIIVRRVSLDEGGGSSATGISRPWKIQYIIANTGLGRATIYEGNATVAVFEKGLPAIPPFDDDSDIACPVTLGTGESTPRLIDLPKGAVESAAMGAGWDQVMGAVAGPGGNPTPNCIYFFGYILYRDDIGIVRRTAFCRLYDFRTKRFSIVNDPDYEYN